ncbi:NAD(P)-binding protein [Apiospora rasikravindrae]|uniref:NAD(P)-binding protein n=1 Tax=Apiospora rasikravindrae TaxID=990691 RepID=A0ABR1RYN5_9PEZI
MEHSAFLDTYNPALFTTCEGVTRGPPANTALSTSSEGPAPRQTMAAGAALAAAGGSTVAEKIITVPNRILERSPSAGARVVTTRSVAFEPEAHGQNIEDGKLQSKAPFVYTPEEDEVGETVWNEIMSELVFTNNAEIVKELEQEL